MGENLSNVSPARINDLVNKLDGKYSDEATRKLIIIGQTKQRKHELITILEEKKKTFNEIIRRLDRDNSNPCTFGMVAEGYEDEKRRYFLLINEIDHIAEKTKKSR